MAKQKQWLFIPLIGNLFLPSEDLEYSSDIDYGRQLLYASVVFVFTLC